MKNRIYVLLVATACLVTCSSGESTITYKDIDASKWSTGSNVGFYATDLAVDVGADADVSASGSLVAPADFKSVFVTVTKLAVNSSNTDTGEPGWTEYSISSCTASATTPATTCTFSAPATCTVASGTGTCTFVGKLDLLALQNGVTSLLTSQKVAAGTYQQVRLKLVPNPTTAPAVASDNANYVVLQDGTAVALDTPSAVQTGIKINNLNVKVDENSKLVIVLDFLVSKSINSLGNGKYLLKPVINANVGTVTSGSTTVTTTTQGTVNLNQ
jgi:hypothetical protein